jgi:putative NIF3 family GTP cyclohydrolase 1 type 2
VAGEIPHHERLEAADEGLGVIEVGHAASERPAVWVLAEWLESAFGSKLDVIRHDAGEAAR